LLKVPIETPNGPGGSFIVNCANVVVDGPVGYPEGTQVFSYVNSRSIIAIVPSRRAADGPIPGCFIMLVDGHKVFTTASADEVHRMLTEEISKA